MKVLNRYNGNHKGKDAAGIRWNGLLTGLWIFIKTGCNILGVNGLLRYKQEEFTCKG